MTNTTPSTADVPDFPAPAPPELEDAGVSAALFGPLLDRLRPVVELDADRLTAPTPCASYTAGDLRDHVLGWLQFFDAALADPDRRTERLDPDAYRVAQDPRDPATVVAEAAAGIDASIASGVAGRRVVMSQMAMQGSAVLAMALGEYLIHGWDLARASGVGWEADPIACEHARSFLLTIVSPEHRSEDGGAGMYGPAVEVPADASPLDALLGFAGRDPSWSPL